MIKVEAERYKYPGKLIEIDGHKMHITGNGEGRPTVVMTSCSGSTCGYTDFYRINSKLSDITRTCVYERPGIGWSEHASTPRSTEQIVSDLHILLEKAGEKPPYILVGYSLGAMEMLLYSHNYPDEVAGIVLIDGGSPYYFIHNKFICNKCIAYCMRFLNFIGIVRILIELKLLHWVNHRIKHLPRDLGKLDKAMIYKNVCNSMTVRELDSIVTTSLKMNEELDLKNVPIIVYTVKESFKKLPTWEESQKSLLKFSSNSRQIILENTIHHAVLQDCWEQITEGINELIINE
jgi:pimeloyl-ACP methyl ester carboxylesterase